MNPAIPKKIGRKDKRKGGVNKLTLFGAATILILSVIAISAPFISPYDPTQINVKEALVQPSCHHLLAPTSWEGTSFHAWSTARAYLFR